MRDSQVARVIDAINQERCIALDLSCHVALYDGEVWNKEIEKALDDKIYSTYKWHISSECKEGKFTIKAFVRSNVEPAYDLDTIYRTEDEKLYTKAGDFRINARQWQEWANKYASQCGDSIRKIK